MTEFTEPKEFLSAIAEQLTDAHGINAAEALERTRTRYPDFSHAEDGRLFIRLSTGVRVRADSAALLLITRELAETVSAPDRAAQIERLKQQKLRSGDYRL